MAQISFYCPIGRDPIASSAEAWSLHAGSSCSFSGPLDTTINRLHLEPPVLNPLLTFSDLEAFLRSIGLRTNAPSARSLRIQLPTGEWLNASLVAAKQMTDTVFQLGAYPSDWGSSFIRIAADSPAALNQFMTLVKVPQSPLFWQNPHLREERQVLPRLEMARTYSPLPLLSKCGGGEWRNFGGNQSLLIVGDLHAKAETIFFENVVTNKRPAWIALETTRDREADLNAFLATKDAIVEAQLLDRLVERKSKDTLQVTKHLLLTIKGLGVKVILVDYIESYFNFPYTSTAFHGLIVAARNLMWVERLPAKWRGTGLLFGGIDHFTTIPGSDFQDFAWERFPQLDMALINPLEKCD